MHSKVIQLYTHTHTHTHIYIYIFFFRFFSIIGYYKILDFYFLMNERLLKSLHLTCFIFKSFFDSPLPLISLPLTHFYLPHSSLSPSARLTFLRHRIRYIICFSLQPDRFDDVHVHKNASL